jgi:hypothetical protein
MKFKQDIIAKIPRHGGTITFQQIQTWINNQPKDKS